MFFLLTVTRTLVCAACVLIVASSAHAQARARSPYVAEAHYTETQAGATNGQARNVTWEIARDRLGRTRVDWGREVFIADPVSGRYLHLDTHARTVREEAIAPRPAATAALSRVQGMPMVADGITIQPVDESSVTPLGTKQIEGYMCEGRRITRSINVDPRRPESRVTVEMEVWTASEIGPLVVTTKTSQGHEQRYALKNIRTEEAPAATFRVPAAFTRISAAPPQPRETLVPRK
jgi:hypothetical protein